MTPEQNKNLILNNLDKFIIDSRGDFINLEKDYKDSDYIIWRDAVEDYGEVREEIIKEIFRDKKKWELVRNIDREIVNGIENSDIIEDIMEEILLEKENWEIVYETRQHWWHGTINIKPISYKHLPTGKEVSVNIFSWMESYILSGELGWRKGMCWDYEKEGSRELCLWKGARGRGKGDKMRKKQERKRKNQITSTPQTPQSPPTQNQTPEPINPETRQENQPNQNSNSTNNKTPSPQQAETEAEENAKQEQEKKKKNEAEERKRQNQEQTQQKDKVITKINNALNPRTPIN